MAGCSILLSMASRVARGESRPRMAAHVLRRSVLILLLGTTNWLGWIYQSGFARGGSTEATPVMFAVAFTGACFVPVWVLWWRRRFLKL